MSYLPLSVTRPLLACPRPSAVPRVPHCRSRAPAPPGRAAASPAAPAPRAARRAPLQPPVGHVQRDLDQRTDRRPSGAPWGVAVCLAVVERGPGDVQVGPPDAVGDELAQEQP